MKFLKLLNPWETQEGSNLSVGEQQKRAGELFPQFVEESNLYYWSPGDEVIQHGQRFLVGLAASFDLRDLRLADIINDQLNHNAAVRVDVFNIAKDCSDVTDLSKYYPNLSASYYASPIVGLWEDGVHKLTQFGFEARGLILEGVKCSMTAEESVAGLCPPDPSLMED